jgi:SAM-dependent methyltransferase
MNEQINREESVHGEQWGELHSGYFSDPLIAQPFLEKVKDFLMKSRADVVVDLGGGTGFLLSQLAAKGPCEGLALVNLDGSDVQLASARQAGITSVLALVTDFHRSDIGPKDKRFFFIMRSVLHYFGEAGLLPVLLHLHSQAREGEIFVHQTASFEDKGDAACLNSLYRHMQSDKWYPTVRELESVMTKAGWRVADISPAPALLLTSDDLARRYTLEMDDIMRIRNVMAQEFGGQTTVFEALPNGFRAKLHYRIYTCVAV